MRTTVLGTYPRIGDTSDEQVLRRTIARFDRGEASEADVRAAERDVVKAALREQIDAGIDVVTDGQIPWNDSQSHIARGMEGIEIGGLVRYFDTNLYYRQPVVTGPVRWTQPILLDEWQFAQNASKAPVKAVLTGPVTLGALALDRHYGKARALALALTDALAEEIAVLRSAGVRHIQVDEPILTRRPEDLPLVADTLESLTSRKGSAELTLSTYFGDVAKIYGDLQSLPVDVIGLDLVQGSKTWAHVIRHGSEKPLALGVVDARNTKLEDPDALASRVRELRDAVPLGESYLSPSNGLEFLPRDRARQKLRVLVETGRRVGGGS